MTALASAVYDVRSAQVFCVSPVSARPAASRAQIRAQNRLLTCGRRGCCQSPGGPSMLPMTVPAVSRALIW